MISYACWKRIGEHPQRVSDQVVLRRLATKDSENSDIIITVTTKLIRDTISARSLEVSSYHLDEPLFLSFVCSYDTLSSAPLQTPNRQHVVCHAFCFVCLKTQRPIATFVFVASFASYASIASVIEWIRRHSYSKSSPTYTVHRSVFCMRASPHSGFSRLCRAEICTFAVQLGLLLARPVCEARALLTSLWRYPAGRPMF